MKVSYSIPLSDDKFGELVVTEVENLNELVRLCRKIRNKNGQFWPPIEEQLCRKTGYNERQAFKYNDFCKKLRDRMGWEENDV